MELTMIPMETSCAEHRALQDTVTAAVLQVLCYHSFTSVSEAFQKSRLVVIGHMCSCQYR